MNFLNRCNGIASTRPRLSAAARNVVQATLPKARADFRNLCFDGSRDGFTYEGRDYYFGSRFDSDNDVIVRIESGLAGDIFSDEEMPDDVSANVDVIQRTYEWCMDALRDCASADHWYTFEKDWG